MTVVMACRLESPRDVLAVAPATAAARARETMADVSDSEYHWESLSAAERLADLDLGPDRKNVWIRIETTWSGHCYQETQLPVSEK